LIGGIDDVRLYNRALSSSEVAQLYALESSRLQFTYTINSDGTATITGYTGSGGVVSIPSSINGVPVVSIGNSAFRYCTNLTEVTVPGSVASIGDQAFLGCLNLAGLTISNGVTHIGQLAFSACWGLTNVSISSSVTNIGSGPFPGCINLLAITVDSANAFYSSVDGVLFDKSQSTLLQCPAAKVGIYSIPSGVTNIGGWAFDGCNGLTGISIPSGVTSIGQSSFSDCYGLTSLSVPASVSQIADFAFGVCTGLTNVLFSGNAPVADSSLFYQATNAIVYYFTSSAEPVAGIGFGKLS